MKFSFLQTNLLSSYVSRETIEKFEIYFSLLNKWNEKYNLVDKKTIQDSFSRHFLDSLQLIKLVNFEQNLLDMGSGAGFPGLILAIAGCENVTLVESNRKKCQFLLEVARQTNTSVEILNKRIEDIKGSFDQFSSRAFANLEVLVEMIKIVSRETKSIGLFLKGQSYQDEIDQAIKGNYSFNYEKIPSLTNSDSVILKIWDIKEK